VIEHAAIIALLVLSIWYTMQEGEIFGKLGLWFYNNLPHKIHPAVFECNICMCFWHGTYLYWLIYGLWLGTATWQEWIVVIIIAMGINIVINKWSPDKEGNTDAARLDEIEQRLDANGIYK